MELIFIRHAQPAWVVDDRSVLDPELTELGHRQAAVLAEHAKHWSPIHAMYVSPMVRTRQTAAPLVEVVGPDVEVIDWFEEMRLPSAWDGAPATEVGGQLRDSRNRTMDGWMTGIGEAYADFEARIVGGLTELLASLGARPIDTPEPGAWTIEDPTKRVLFIGHGGSNSVSLGHLLGLPAVPWPWERLCAMHASISRVKAVELRNGFIFGLRDHSNVGYLPKEMWSR